MENSTAHSTKRIRKGTKSCIECRQRKIRCIWENEIDRVCKGCKTRQRECVPQIHQRRSNASDASRADRIDRLERQLASIAAAVQKGGNVENGTATASKMDLSATAEEIAEESTMEGPATTPPSHLRFLFDNSLIAPSSQHDETHHAKDMPCSKNYLEQARTKLQRLMPIKRDVVAAASFGTAWMRLHQSLFTSELPFSTSEAMVDTYDDQLLPDAQIVDLACFLLVFAVNVRQVPIDDQRLTLKDIPQYIQDVLHVVESTIVSHTGIVSTIEGLTATILYMRLQLGFGQIRPLWLTLRRTIAIAELIGLPRTYNSYYVDTQRVQMAGDPKVAQRVALWEAICATDRLSSMMFNLPAATATHSFPKRQTLSSAGVVLSQPYLLELADIGMRVQQLDESHTSGKPKSEVYEKVLTIDSDIQSLKSLTPRRWWEEGDTPFSGNHLVQFWHYYLLVRTHVHSAMDSDEHDQYKYSRMACSEACQSLAQRYGYVRRKLPPGFFICRIIDMQVFSAATFLILSCYKEISAHSGQGFPAPRNEQRVAAVQHILATMESVLDQTGSDFAREAASAITSLMALLENPAMANSQGLTMRIPLMGKIHIAARKQVSTDRQPSIDQLRQPPPPLTDQSETITSIPISGNEVQASMDSLNFQSDALPWDMELDMGFSSLQDPLITDDFGNWDYYMGMGGMNP